MTTSQISKMQLLRTIDELQRRPLDRVRLLGDLGVTSLGVGLGAAAAGTAATLAGATAIPAITTAASWIGVTAVAVTPVGWVIGAAVAGGAAAYGISRLVHGGGLSEGRRAELLLTYRERLIEIEQKERASQIALEDKNQFVFALREVVAKNAITPQRALDLIQNIESGKMKISDAYELVLAVLQEASRETR